MESSLSNNIYFWKCSEYNLYLFTTKNHHNRGKGYVKMWCDIPKKCPVCKRKIIVTDLKNEYYFGDSKIKKICSKTFISACVKGELNEVLKACNYLNLEKSCSLTHTSRLLRKGFILLCKFGYLNIIIEIFAKYSSFKRSLLNYKCYAGLSKACENNHEKIVKFLLNEYDEICGNNKIKWKTALNIELVSLEFEKYTNKNDCGFFSILINCFSNNRLEIAEILFTYLNFACVENKVDMEYIMHPNYLKLCFKFIEIGCKAGNVKIVKWFWNRQKINELLINYEQYFNNLFLESCKLKRLEIIQWIKSLFPKNYQYKIKKNDYSPNIDLISLIITNNELQIFQNNCYFNPNLTNLSKILIIKEKKFNLLCDLISVRCLELIKLL